MLVVYFVSKDIYSHILLVSIIRERLCKVARMHSRCRWRQRRGENIGSKSYGGLGGMSPMCASAKKITCRPLGEIANEKGHLWRMFGCACLCNKVPSRLTSPTSSLHPLIFYYTLSLQFKIFSAMAMKTNSFPRSDPTPVVV